jgi:hypothetical protein
MSRGLQVLDLHSEPMNAESLDFAKPKLFLSPWDEMQQQCTLSISECHLTSRRFLIKAKSQKKYTWQLKINMRG